jgi:hypothetical protein
MDYLNKEKKNKHEEAVRQHFHAQGFKSLSRGWPDFVFFKPSTGQKLEVVFVEVKPPGGQTIKTHQGAMKEILESFGCDVRVAFGVDEQGIPVYKKIEGRVSEDASEYKRSKLRPLNIWHESA